MGEPIAQLRRLVARLRDPVEGCPWDINQTHASLAPFAIEEAYEVVDAIENGTPEDLRFELGDLLFQVVLHAQLAAEAGHFDFDSVATAVSEKMIRRHPHVFAKGDMASPKPTWEQIKRAEQGSHDGQWSVMSDVAVGLPELLRAVKLQKRAASVGFDWNDPWPVVDKVSEELREVAAELRKVEPPGAAPSQALVAELGDLLFACVNLSRQAGVEPGQALRAANKKFENRFLAMERLARERGDSFEDLSLGEQEELWLEVKRRECLGD